jgi:DNA-binding Lrp family transcriptional regulator
MTDDTTKQVLRKLMQDHVGRENAITQSQLADALGINPSTLRSELRRLREERQIPIGNLRDGYYIIGDREELQEYVGHINSEIESKRRTIEHTVEAFAEFDAKLPEEATQDVQEQTYPCSDCGTDTSKTDCYWLKDGEHAGTGPYCKRCFGTLLTTGEA